MSTSGPPRRLRVRTFFEQNVVWPFLDLRDWLLRRHRKEPPPLYETHHVPLRKKLRWAALDAVDSLRAPVTRRHPRWRLTALRAAQIAALPLVLVGAIAFAAAGNDDEGGGENRASAVEPAAAPEGPRSGVGGVQDDSEARRERAAKRRAAARRRAVRRKRAARRRAIARRRAAERRRARARAGDTPPPTAPAVEEGEPEPDGSPSAPPQDFGPPPSSSAPAPAPAPAPSPAPPSPPSGGGGSGGGGGGSNQPAPGVEFDDSG
jgi:hypothetical protein